MYGFILHAELVHAQWCKLLKNAEIKYSSEIYLFLSHIPVNFSLSIFFLIVSVSLGTLSGLQEWHPLLFHSFVTSEDSHSTPCLAHPSSSNSDCFGRSSGATGDAFLMEETSFLSFLSFWFTRVILTSATGTSFEYFLDIKLAEKETLLDSILTATPMLQYVLLTWFCRLEG